MKLNHKNGNEQNEEDQEASEPLDKQDDNNKNNKQDHNTWTERVPKSIRPLLGILVCFVGAAFFCTTNVMVKKLKADSFTISTVRFLMIGLLAQPVALWRWQYKDESPHPKGSRFKLFLRSLFGASNLIIHFYALKHISLPDAVMISACAPIFTAFFARILIKEKITVVDIINLILVFVGIVLIVKPPFLFGENLLFTKDPEAILAVVLLILGSIFLQANVYVILRMIKEIHWCVVLNYFGWFGFVEGLILCFVLGFTCLPDSDTERAVMVAIGLLSYFGQICLVVSAQLEKASTVALLRKAFDVGLAFAFQMIFFQENPELFSILGATFISVAIFLSGTKKIVDNLPENHRLRQVKLLHYSF